jgi:hypothetical protein
MSIHPNPIASSAKNSPSKVRRRIFCAGYESCLDIALKKKWTGFSCRKCKAFEPSRLTLSEWFEDSLACAALIYVVEFQGSFKQKPRGSIVLKLKRARSRGDLFDAI